VHHAMCIIGTHHAVCVYLGGIEGWVDVDGWLHTKKVYLCASCYPLKY